MQSKNRFTYKSIFMCLAFDCLSQLTLALNNFFKLDWCKGTGMTPDKRFCSELEPPRTFLKEKIRCFFAAKSPDTVNNNSRISALPRYGMAKCRKKNLNLATIQRMLDTICQKQYSMLQIMECWSWYTGNAKTLQKRIRRASAKKGPANKFRGSHSAI